MLLESRKIHLIEKVLKIESAEVISKLESVLKLPKIKKKASASRFAGTISKKDISLMVKAIEEGCEQVNADDWK